MFLRDIPKVLESKRARRDVEVLAEDRSLECPAVIFSVGYCDSARSENLISRYRKKDGKLDVEGSRGVQFKQDIMRDVVLLGRNSDIRWSGLTLRNLRRLCPAYMEHPELLPDGDETKELELGDDDLIVLAGQMLDDYVLALYIESQNLSEFAREQINKKKS